MFGMVIGKDEAFEILVSVLAISLALAFATSGLNVPPSQFIFLIAAFTITVGSGFILHELAHRYYAIKFGAKARFKAWPLGLAAGLALAIVPQLLGWGRAPLFLAPGAVYIYSLRRLSPKENGIISIAGPAMNWALALIFLTVSLLFGGNEIIAQIGSLGASANMMLAMFNLLPIFPLDGSKVLAWDKSIWLAAFLFSLAGMLFMP